jgi:hypothetical protein
MRRTSTPARACHISSGQRLVQLSRRLNFSPLPSRRSTRNTNTRARVTIEPGLTVGELVHELMNFLQARAVHAAQSSYKVGQQEIGGRCRAGIGNGRDSLCWWTFRASALALTAAETRRRPPDDFAPRPPDIQTALFPAGWEGPLANPQSC